MKPLHLVLMSLALVLVTQSAAMAQGTRAFPGFNPAGNQFSNFNPGAFSNAHSTPAFIPAPVMPASPPCPFNSPFAPTSTPPGTFPVCGTGLGQFRPQPFTLAPGLPPREASANGNFYAPVGKNGQDWYQLSPGSATTTAKFGPREPNPFDMNGNLSVPRALNHVTQTRIIPAIQRRFR